MTPTKATGARKPSAFRLNRLQAAPACAVVLLVLLSGNVAAKQLANDQRNGPLVTPKVTSVPARSHLAYKLGTTAGYRVLAFG
jgi:hypothetical protein